MVNPINSQWLESKNKLKDLLSNLKCTICHEVLAEATVTNCGHSYCNLCIETWKKDQSKLLEYGQNKLVKCPNCNTEIKTLSTNHMLKTHIEEMCDILLSEQEKSVRQKTIQENIDAQIERAAIARARDANALALNARAASAVNAGAVNAGAVNARVANARIGGVLAMIAPITPAITPVQLVYPPNTVQAPIVTIDDDSDSDDIVEVHRPGFDIDEIIQRAAISHARAANALAVNAGAASAVNASAANAGNAANIMSPPRLSLNPSTTGNTIAMVNLETTTQNNPSSTYDNIVPALDIDIYSDIDMENSLNAPAASTIVEPETGAPTQSRSSITVPEEEQPIRSNQYKNGESTSVDQESIEHSRPSLRGSLKDIQAKMRLDNQRYQKANLVRLNGHGSNRDMPRPRQSSTRNMPRPSPYRREEHPSRRPSNRR